VLTWNILFNTFRLGKVEEKLNLNMKRREKMSNRIKPMILKKQKKNKKIKKFGIYHLD